MRTLELRLVAEVRYHAAVRPHVFAVLAAASAGCSLLVGEGFTSDEPAPSATTTTDGATSDASIADASTRPPSDAATDAGSRYASAVLADKPVGYWRCNETGGAKLADSSGHDHTATITAPLGATLGKSGALANDADTAIELDGTTDLDVGDLFDFAGQVPFTYEVWFKPRVHDRMGFLFSKMKHQESFVPLEGTYLYYDGMWNGTARIALERWSEGAAVNGVFHDGEQARLPLDRFVHLVVAFDGAAPRLFVDGKVVKTGFGGTPIPDTTISLKLAQNLVGEVDELAIYDVALTPARIQAHYDAAK